MTLTEPTAEDLAAVEQGAMSVVQACEFTGDGRVRLYQLMDAGTLEWFYVGPHRRITRASLVRYMAALLAEHKANPVKREGPHRKAKTK